MTLFCQYGTGSAILHKVRVDKFYSFLIAVFVPCFFSCFFVVFRDSAQESFLNDGSTSNHKQSLPNPQPNARDDSFEQAENSVLLNNMPEYLQHTQLFLSCHAPCLHFNACYLKRMIPTGQSTTDDSWCEQIVIGKGGLIRQRTNTGIGVGGKGKRNSHQRELLQSL